MQDPPKQSLDSEERVRARKEGKNQMGKKREVSRHRRQIVLCAKGSWGTNQIAEKRVTKGEKRRHTNKLYQLNKGSLHKDS